MLSTNRIIVKTVVGYGICHIIYEEEPHVAKSDTKLVSLKGFYREGPDSEVGFEEIIRDKDAAVCDNGYDYSQQECLPYFFDGHGQASLSQIEVRFLPDSHINDYHTQNAEQTTGKSPRAYCKGLRLWYRCGYRCGCNVKLAIKIAKPTNATQLKASLMFQTWSEEGRGLGAPSASSKNSIVYSVDLALK